MKGRPPKGYGPELRIRRKSEYARASAAGVTVRDRFLKVVAARGPAGHTRLGTVISRRGFGGAVERNRARRRLREAFRLARGELPPGLDLVVTPLRQEPEPHLPALEQSLLSLAREALSKLEAKEKL